ncbi:PqqD family peptide modification chaperone [Halomonas sp. NO4]|uniref:PqqD family peptide modification chaperone n=1 Tax=Halomonas sp. NO4 TaxID=2484813 RepID=UPI0013D4C472|nr:PqqD family peptide modification chaperone [Halomonas sp. NO4]
MELCDRIRRSGEPLASRVDDELVLFSAENGMYYGTQAVGERIWSLVERECTVAELCERLMAEFDVPRVTCEREVMDFLESLHQEALIVVNPD